MAHRYQAQIEWSREPQQAFIDNRYSRRHHIHFDGGLSLAASSSPTVVPLPYSDPNAADPEELLVAALSSCHMLWFLSLAAQQGWCVEHYHDAAEGVMQRNAAGKLAITQVVLQPQVRFSGTPPSAEQFQALHEQAHAECFIAHSVTAEVVCQAMIRA